MKKQEKEDEKRTIPIQDKRKAFSYAVAFLRDEIHDIEEALKHAHFLENTEKLLRKRLAELMADLTILESYEIHD